jgi:hypothetical protein
MKKKSRHSPLSLSIKPIDRVAVKILGGDEKNDLADTDPDLALEKCLNWAYKGIEDVNELRHIEGRLKQQILDLIADLQRIPGTEAAERKTRIHRFEAWLGAHPPHQSPTGKWNI